MTPIRQPNLVVKEPGFVSQDDLRRGAERLQLIVYLAFIVIAVLIGRLWWLQGMNGSAYAERADQNRFRLLPIPGAARRDL
jgi:cell division protein FtsI/penicillin-binding protein 2